MNYQHPHCTLLLWMNLNMLKSDYHREKKEIHELLYPELSWIALENTAKIQLFTPGLLSLISLCSLVSKNLCLLSKLWHSLCPKWQIPTCFWASSWGWCGQNRSLEGYAHPLHPGSCHLASPWLITERKTEYPFLSFQFPVCSFVEGGG